MDFSQYEEEGYAYKVYSGEAEVDELTVTGNATLKIVYEREAQDSGCGSFVVGGPALLGFAAMAVLAAVVLKKRKQR